MTPDTPADGEALAEAEPYVWTWQSCESSQGWNTKFGDAPPKPGPWISDVMPLYAHPASRPAEPAQAAQVEANQRRADAATLLLDMLYMRNGAHEGLDRDAVEKMWNAVREDDGFPSVVQFLSVIAAAQEGRHDD